MIQKFEKNLTYENVMALIEMMACFSRDESSEINKNNNIKFLGQNATHELYKQLYYESILRIK